jgi:hypothetical protein
MAAVAAPPVCATWDDLPSALALRIFALVPVDARVRCAAVRKAWHALLLGSPGAWAHLDLSAASGVTCGASVASVDELLRGASALAAGALVSLDVSGRNTLRAEALLEVVAANATTLREMRATVRARARNRRRCRPSVSSRAAAAPRRWWRTRARATRRTASPTRPAT